MERPSLHEIAAMPFPASQDAMRKHYDPSWHRTGDEGKPLWRFAIEYSFVETETETFEVEAYDADEARELAKEQCREIHGSRDGFEMERIYCEGQVEAES